MTDPHPEIPDSIWAYKTSGSNNRHFTYYEIQSDHHRKSVTKYIRADRLMIAVEALRQLSTISSEPDKICDTFEYRAVRMIAKEALAKLEDE